MIRRRSFRLGILLASAALLALAACQPTKPPAPPPPAGAPNLTVDTLVTGLDRPWDVGFVPGDANTFFFPENNAGTIKVWRTGTVTNLPLTGTPTPVAMGEGGMLGLAVDPSFSSNRFIYACFSTGTDNRVVRWTVNTAFTALESRTDIVTDLPYNTSTFPGRHSGCRPRFGPDGFLWIGTGDAATGINPQSESSLGGKVLRVDRDGNAAAGNDPPAGFDPRIYTYGHRNVQGITFRPGTGETYSIEHGTGCDDEVNRSMNGENYGWDPVPGYDESTPMTDFTKFPNAIRAAWASGCPTIAPSGGTFLIGPQWEAWDGDLAAAVLAGRRLRVFNVDGGGGISGFTDVLQDNVRLRVAVQGPDGNLYITTDANPGGDAIWRVTPS